MLLSSRSRSAQFATRAAEPDQSGAATRRSKPLLVGCGAGAGVLFAPPPLPVDVCDVGVGEVVATSDHAEGVSAYVLCDEAAAFGEACDVAAIGGPRKADGDGDLRRIEGAGTGQYPPAGPVGVRNAEPGAADERYAPPAVGPSWPAGLSQEAAAAGSVGVRDP